MAKVLGIDSSTQSTKALLLDADTGELLGEGWASHPDGTEVSPQAWLDALETACSGLLEQADAVAVGGQQHGMVLLDEAGEVVRDALLWNDTRSAKQAQDLIAEMGGPEAAAERTGSVLVASITASKLRWVSENEPENMARAAQVLLPHDYISAYLAQKLGAEDFQADGFKAAFTDHGDASGTGYYNPRQRSWDQELLQLAAGKELLLPALPDTPQQVRARGKNGVVFGSGTGDNMAAALALELGSGDVSVSIGTSGVCAMVSEIPTADASGMVTGFADTTGRFLPLTCTLNAAKILDFGCQILGVDHDELARLALSAPSGANGVILQPYFAGERTPNRPHATATLTGMRPDTMRADIARACVEGLLCSLADGIEALEAATATSANRVLLIGGAARNAAVQAIAPGILGRDITVPAPGEYVARGAARQAAWVLSGADSAPVWGSVAETVVPCNGVEHAVVDAYQELKARTVDW